MNMHKIVLTIGLLGLMAPVVAMETKVDLNALEEKKAAAASAAADARMRSADAKSSVAAQAGKVKPKGNKHAELLAVLEADESLKKAKLPTAVLALMADYAEIKPLEYFPAVFSSRKFAINFTQDIRSAVALPGNKLALFAQLTGGFYGSSNTVYILDTITGNIVRKIKVLAGGDFRVASMGVTSDGKNLVVGGKGRKHNQEPVDDEPDEYVYKIEVWDTATYTLTKKISQKELAATVPAMKELLVLRNGIVAFEEQDHKGAITLYDPLKDSVVCVLQGHTNEVTIMRTTDDCSQIVTGSLDGTIRIWDFKGNQKKVFKTDLGIVNDLFLAQDGTIVGFHEKSVQVCDPVAGTCSPVLKIDVRGGLLGSVVLLAPTVESLKELGALRAMPEGDLPQLHPYQQQLSIHKSIVRFPESFSPVIRTNGHMFVQRYDRGITGTNTFYMLDENAFSELKQLSSYQDLDELLAGLDLRHKEPLVLNKHNKCDARLIELYNALPPALQENIRSFYDLKIVASVHPAIMTGLRVVNTVLGNADCVIQ